MPFGSLPTSFDMSANWENVLPEPARPATRLTSSQATRQEENGRTQGRFACPFLKGPVNRSQLNRACLGHGWTRLHRVTEHIRRCHIPAGFIKSLICNRCHKGFLSHDLLVQHQRQENPCPITEPEIVSGKVTLEQAAKLTAAKRKRPRMSDEMRWFEIYDIIFPDQDPGHRPLTPYHQPLANLTSETSSALAFTITSRYQDSFMGPSNPAKKRKLEEKLKDWGVSDPRLCRTLAAKVQEYQVEDLQDFMEAGADASNIEVGTAPNPPQQDLDGCWEFDFAQFNASDLFFYQDI